MELELIIAVIILVGSIVAGIARSFFKKTEKASVEPVPNQPVSTMKGEKTLRGVASAIIVIASIIAFVGIVVGIIYIIDREYGIGFGVIGAAAVIFITLCLSACQAVVLANISDKLSANSPSTKQ